MADRERLESHLWDAVTDNTFRKAIFDYNLVCNYIERSMGGKRWLPEDIENIKYFGEGLEDEIKELNKLWNDTDQARRVGLAKLGIDDKVKKTKKFAQQTIKMINDSEQLPVFVPMQVDEFGRYVTGKWGFGADEFTKQSDFVSLTTDPIVTPGRQENDSVDDFQIKGASEAVQLTREQMVVSLEKKNPVGATKRGADRAKKKDGRRSRSPGPPGHGIQRSRHSPNLYRGSGKRPLIARVADTWSRVRDGSP